MNAAARRQGANSTLNRYFSFPRPPPDDVSLNNVICLSIAPSGLGAMAGEWDRFPYDPGIASSTGAPSSGNRLLVNSASLSSVAISTAPLMSPQESARWSHFSWGTEFDPRTADRPKAGRPIMPRDAGRAQLLQQIGAAGDGLAWQ